MGDLFAGVPPSIVPRYVGCTPELLIQHLRVDSREVASGDAFLAVAGATHDGHAFVAKARAAGASVAIVERLDAHDAGPSVILESTEEAAPYLAANAFGRPGTKLELAAVTGTNGKTTTAHLVGALLEGARYPYLRLGTTGNWLVDREVPAAYTTAFPTELQALLAAAVTAGATHGVMEVSSHALTQRRVEPLRFRAVGMTSFSQDHLDFHPSMEAYLEAKLTLARVHLGRDAIAVAATDAGPAMQRFLEEAAQHGATVWTAGQRSGSAIYASHVVYGHDRTRARVETPAGAFELSSPLLAPYNLDNTLVAVGLALGLGVPLSTIAAALEHASGAPGRLERVEVPGVAGPKVLVDYAHTPDAVERALAAVRSIATGRVTIVLGCGGDRDPSKRAPMAQIAARDADRFWLTADNPRTEDPRRIAEDMLAGMPSELLPRIRVELDRAVAIADAIGAADATDWVLVAGKGHEDYQIVGRERRRFDDREEARTALKSRLP